MSSDCPRTDAALELEITQLNQQLEQVGQTMVNARNAAVALVKECDQLKQQLEDAIEYRYRAMEYESEASEANSKLLGSQLREQRLREALEKISTTNQAQRSVQLMAREALSTPSDSSVLKEIREALESCTQSKHLAQGDDCSGIYEYTITEQRYNATKVAHALTLLGGGKDK